MRSLVLVLALTGSASASPMTVTGDVIDGRTVIGLHAIVGVPGSFGSNRGFNSRGTFVAKVTFAGASGTVAFDQYGDTVTKTLTVYKVVNGNFAPVKSGEFKG